jgi:hypothetical protein
VVVALADIFLPLVWCLLVVTPLLWALEARRRQVTKAVEQTGQTHNLPHLLPPSAEGAVDSPRRPPVTLAALVVVAVEMAALLAGRALLVKAMLVEQLLLALIVAAQVAAALGPQVPQVVAVGLPPSLVALVVSALQMQSMELLPITLAAVAAVQKAAQQQAQRLAVKAVAEMAT